MTRQIWTSKLAFALFLATIFLGGETGVVFAAPPADAEVGAHEAAAPDQQVAAHVNVGHLLPMYTMLPFVLLLACIAIMPLANGHWWEHNRNKGLVVALVTVPLAIYLALVWHTAGWHQLREKTMEYCSFIILLGSLFVISGGIYVRGTLRGTPEVNVGLLALGAVIASFVGTTGASMLLIRPLLRANAYRERKAHTVVLFIFIVSNCGGLLTPLGDPPLYLGFLNGVPFTWTFRLWGQWAFVNGGLLLIYYVWDRLLFVRDAPTLTSADTAATREPLRIDGAFNILLLLGIVLVIYASGNGLLNGGVPWSFPMSEGLMLLLGSASYFLTPRGIHEQNRFSFAPINEVAILFSGIFVTMIPALLILNAHGKEMHVTEPWQFFWVSGMLSSVLDNAPTYLTFAATACGLADVDVGAPRYLATFLATPRGPELLAAISCGSVFMGANTYIGNGPNFMVKAIAEQSGVKMPGFFGYMLYSGCILLPLFGLVTAVFFWR